MDAAAANAPVALDAHALARWTPDPHTAYAVILTHLVDGNTAPGDAAFHAAVDLYLSQLTSARILMLVDDVIQRTIGSLHECVEEAVCARQQPTQLVVLDAPTTRFIRRLAFLLVRLRMDQAGWDFVGVALFASFLRSCDFYDGNVIGTHEFEYEYTLAIAVSRHILQPLIAQFGTAHTLGLDWDRLRALTTEWVQRGAAVHQFTGSIQHAPHALLTTAALEDWTFDLGAEDRLRHHWNASIHAAQRRLAFAAQTELERGALLPADLTGAIVHFIAPPSTSQADLQRQRRLHTATIAVAQMQLRANKMAAEHGPDAAQQQQLANQARAAVHGLPLGHELPPSTLPRPSPLGPPSAPALLSPLHFF